MEETDRFKVLRKLLYKEIQGELSYFEKKEFLEECISEGVIAKLHGKYLKRKQYLVVFGILYGVFLMILFITILMRIGSHILIGLIVLAMALLPLFIGLFYSKAVLGYEKLDLALRLITRFYVRKKIDS